MAAPIIASASTQSHFFNELPSPISADAPSSAKLIFLSGHSSIKYAFEIQN